MTVSRCGAGAIRPQFPELTPDNGKGKTMTELLTEWAFVAGSRAGAAIHAATGWLSGWLPWLHETVAPFAAIAIQGGEK